MSDFLTQLVARANERAAMAPPGSHLGAAVRRRGVAKSAELMRVAALPVRHWTDAEAAELAAFLTDRLRTPDGTMALRPLQAIALGEGLTGVFGPLGVGKGKTLITALLPTLLDARRPLLLIPAHLKTKTEREFAAYAKHWRVHPSIRIVSYQWLGRESAAKFLDEYRPDLIMADEAHRLKNSRAACTRRVQRYLKADAAARAAGAPGAVRFAPFSGTMTKRSLRDYAHLLAWALQAGAPVPLQWTDLEAWSLALDEKVNPLSRYGPGALLEFATPDERERHEPRIAARLGYQRRLVSTPGVVTSAETEDCEAEIAIVCHAIAPDDAVDGHFARLREDWTTPDGWPLSDGFAVWACARQLSLGFHYAWDPRPPDEWLDARRAWAKFVREVLRTNRRQLDTELQVARACAAGELPGEDYAAWVRVRDTFKPVTVPRWHSGAALLDARKWLVKEGGICWVEHVEFGKALAESTGLPFFHRRGLDDAGRFIDDHSGRPCIASIESNSEGRNLQAWSRSLIVSPPPNGLRWEQNLGRLHRPGQEADEIQIDVWIRCSEHMRAVRQAIRDAHHAHQTMGQSQKLLLADLQYPQETDMFSLSRYSAFQGALDNEETE